MSQYGPEFDAYADHVRNKVVPKMKESSFFISITPSNPEEVDVKFAMELGLAIMLDKPIIACISPGTKVPEKLARVVEKFVELDLGSEHGKQRLQDAITELMEELP